MQQCCRAWDSFLWQCVECDTFEWDSLTIILKDERVAVESNGTMAKQLLSASAGLMLCAASAVSAAEWETRINGFYFLGLGVSDSNSQSGIGILRDGEAHVNARLISDGGLIYSARIELEAFTSGDQIDENWGSVSGPFGTFLVGSNDDAVYNNHVGAIFAPGTRIGYYDAFGLTTQGRAVTALPGNGSDQIGVHYTSPSLSGFKVYGSYHPSSNTDGGADSNNPVFSSGEFYTVGASYNGNFDDFGIGLSAGYTDLPGTELITIGAKATVAGLSIAGTYENIDQAGGDRDEYAIGAQYSSGPWTVGGGYSDEQDNGEQAAGWVTYGLAPGVLFTAGVEYGDSNGVPGSDLGGLAYLTMRF